MLQKNHDSLMTHEEVEEFLRKATNKAVIEIQKKHEQKKIEFVEAEIERLRNQIKHDFYIKIFMFISRLWKKI